MKTQKTKSTTHYLLLLDRSGSMASCWGATTEALMAQMESIKRLAAEHPALPIKVTVAFFNTTLSYFINAAPAESLSKINLSGVDPEGGTALLDAMAVTLNTIDEQMAEQDDAIAVILTDGEENASRMYSYDYVGCLIGNLKSSERWKFKMLGADFDSFTNIGSKINLSLSENLMFKKVAVREVMESEMMALSEHMLDKKIRFDDNF
jgi:hypothetical protein